MRYTLFLVITLVGFVSAGCGQQVLPAPTEKKQAPLPPDAKTKDVMIHVDPGK
jgi:hypothetical protein